MRKKGYKQMQRRLLRETKLRVIEWGKRLQAEENEMSARMAEKRMRQRLRSIGTNLETVSEDVPGALKILRREIKPEEAKAWARLCAWMDIGNYPEEVENLKRELAQDIAEQIVENDLAQLIVREANEIGGPLQEYSTALMKVYVVPWDQMARSEGKRFELNELINPGRVET